MATNTAAAKGTVSWLQSAGNNLMDYFGQGEQYSWPEIADFASWLDQMTSPDATARMTAAGSQIADITSQTEATKSSIKNLPRGGEQDYLLANADQAKSTAIGNLLTSEFASAETAKGTLGEWGVGTTMQGFMEASNIEGAAGNLAMQLIQGDAAGSQGMMQTLAEIGVMAAQAFA